MVVIVSRAELVCSKVVTRVGCVALDPQRDAWERDLVRLVEVLYFCLFKSHINVSLDPRVWVAYVGLWN